MHPHTQPATLHPINSAKPRKPPQTRTTAPVHQADDQHSALLRIWQIIGDPKRGIAPLLPISRSTFLAKVKSREYPQPVRLSERCTAWRKADIMALLESFNGKSGAA